MKGVVLKVSPLRNSRYGGQYKRAVIKDLDSGDEFLFDCYLNHISSARFLPVLKTQAILDNLSLVEVRGKKFINGYSSFKYIGQRH